MAQDSAPSAPSGTSTTTADVANAKNRNLSLSQIATKLSDGSSSVIAALGSIATAITNSIIGGTTGSNANRILVAKGTGGRALQPTATALDPSTGVFSGTAVWNGSVIGPAYGGTGVANNAASTWTISGNFATTITVTGTTALTFPTSGTLVTTTASQALTNKTETYAAGTTGVAPVVFTPGTNLTTAAAGAEEFDGTCFYATAAASSRQVVDAEQFICLSSDYTLTDGSAAQKAFNSSTNGALTVQGSTTYLFAALYMGTNTGTTSHLWGVLFGGTATFTSGAYIANGRTATAANAYGTSGTVSTTTPGTVIGATTASTSATENVTIELRGVLRINAGGTLIPQIQFSAQPNGTEKMLANSFFRIWPVGSNSVTNVGNWS